MHSLYLSHLREIADGSCHAIAIKQNLFCLLCSACLYTTVSSYIGILTLQLPIPMLLSTQLPFLVWNDVRQMMIMLVVVVVIYDKSQLYKLVWGSLTFAPINHHACIQIQVSFKWFLRISSRNDQINYHQWMYLDSKKLQLPCSICQCWFRTLLQHWT